MGRRILLQWTIGLSLFAAVSFTGISAVIGPLATASHPQFAHLVPSVPNPVPAPPALENFADSVGTAFSVGPGALLTNAHVTLRCSAGRLPIRVAGHSGPWWVAWEDRDLDLALLRGPDHSALPALALSAMTHVPRNTVSLVLGYPVNDEDAATPYAALGTVRQATIMVHQPQTGQAASFRATDRAGRLTDPTWRDGMAFFGYSGSERMRWALEIAVTMGHGASGGPVVDSTGSVLGVVVADGTDRGLTSAITLADLAGFLASAGIVPRFVAPMEHDEVDWSRVYRLAALSVVRISCETAGHLSAIR